jgi:hypothetical protein
MDVQLTLEESSALRHAHDSYLSDLRMEIRDTDNPGYRRDLRTERGALESIVTKLGQGAATSSERDAEGRVVVRFVGIWTD